MFENAIKNIGRFYELDLAKNTHADEMFDVLSSIIRFDKAAVFYLAPGMLTLEYGKNYEIYEPVKLDNKISKILFDKTKENITEILKNIFGANNLLASRLVVKGAVIGLLVVERTENEFSFDEKLIFETCAKIIANLIKDLEVSNVLKMQVKAMAEGLLETRQTYETIKKQNEQIKASEKLQNEFIANISHDLRTPLNAIINISEALGGNFFGELNPKQKDYVSDIKLSGLKLMHMINEILDIAKIESHTARLNLSEFMICDAVFEVCNLIKPVTDKKNLVLETNVDKHIKIRADYVKFQQILLNLLSNASKYAKSKICITCSVDIEKVQISVKDDGFGIDQKYHGKIFDKFFQVEDSLQKTETSTGLGLTIVKEFVKLHGGKVSVKSSPDDGAEFIVTFSEDILVKE